jgi:hypothetical protein
VAERGTPQTGGACTAQCGHCARIKPAYEEAARLLAGQSTLLVARMDATVNQVGPAAAQAPPHVVRDLDAGQQKVGRPRGPACKPPVLVSDTRH